MDVDLRKLSVRIVGLFYAVVGFVMVRLTYCSLRLCLLTVFCAAVGDDAYRCSVMAQSALAEDTGDRSRRGERPEAAVAAQHPRLPPAQTHRPLSKLLVN